MKIIRIGRFSSAAKRKAERNLVKALGGTLYAERGGHKPLLAELPDSAPVSLSACMVPPHVFEAIKGRRFP